jgi:hypothetical protein
MRAANIKRVRIAVPNQLDSRKPLGPAGRSPDSQGRAAWRSVALVRHPTMTGTSSASGARRVRNGGGEIALSVDVLRLKPWQWPAYETPNSDGDYEPDAAAIARYHALKAVADKAKPKRKA